MASKFGRSSKTSGQRTPEPAHLVEDEGREQQHAPPLTLRTPTPPADAPLLRRQQIARLQRAQGNAVVARRLQREPTVKPQWQQDMEREGAVMELPKAFKWDFADPIATDELAPWATAPNYSTPTFAKHLGEPFINNYLVAPMNQRKGKFSADWAQLTTTWNNARTLATQFKLKSKTPPGADPAQPGPASGIADQDSEAAKPKGEQGQSVGSLFDESNPAAVKVNAKTPFDPSKLAKADRETYDTKVKTAHEASNAVKDAKLQVDSALSKVEVSKSQQAVAELKLKQAEAGAEAKGVAGQKIDLQAEQAQIKNLLDAIGAAASMGGSLAEGKGYGAAKEGVTYIGALIAMEYTERTRKIDASLAQIDLKIAGLQVQCEVEGVRQAVQAIKQATIEVKRATLALSNADLAEKQAFRYLSEAIEELGKKIGMDPDSIKAASTAAAALPLLEDTIKQFEQVETAIQPPAYSEESGGGAAFALNIGDFVLHLAQLKGFKQQLAAGRAQWERRRDAARAGIGMPAAPTL